MTNILPEELEENTIEGMSPGDEGYTVPWAMFADSDRRLWINRNYTVYKEPGGTVCMHITMLENRVVQVKKSTIGDHRYSPRDSGWVHLGVGYPVDLR